VKRAGFRTLSVFIEAFFGSDGDAAKRRAGKFFQLGGYSTCVSAMIQQRWLGPSRRAMKVREEVGEEIGDLFLRILDAEMDQLGKEPSLRLNPDAVKASDIEEFSFAKHMDQYETHALTLSWLVKQLCKVTEANSVVQSEHILPGSNRDCADVVRRNRHINRLQVRRLTCRCSGQADGE